MTAAIIIVAKSPLGANQWPNTAIIPITKDPTDAE